MGEDRRERVPSRHLQAAAQVLEREFSFDPQAEMMAARLKNAAFVRRIVEQLMETHRVKLDD